MSVTTAPAPVAPAAPVRATRGQAYAFGVASLVLVSFVAAASYFAYDCVGPLAPALKDPVTGLGLNSAEIGLLYSVYSIPVILFVLVGGVLADRLGVRTAGMIFTVMFAAGAALTAFGEFSVMIAGRVLFGIGAEAFYVVMNKVIAKWFKDKFLATAFGANLLLCRAGTYLAFFGLPWLASEMGGWQATLWLIAGICGLAIVAMAVYMVLDRIGDRRGMTAVEEKPDAFRLGDVLRLPAAFWVISGLCMVYYSAIFPFQAHAVDFIAEHHYADMADREAAAALAGQVTSVIILMSMVFTWLFGLVVDRFGKRATMMIIGSVLLAPTHVALAYLDVPPLVPLVVMGLSFSLVPAALWPALPLMVRENQLGTAYGMIAMVQNIGLFAFPLLAGLIRDETGSFELAMVMFSGLGVVAIGLSIWLKVLETKQGSYLDRRASAG